MKYSILIKIFAVNLPMFILSPFEKYLFHCLQIERRVCFIKLDKMGEALLVEPVTAYTVTCAPCCFILLSTANARANLAECMQGEECLYAQFRSAAGFHFELE